MPKALWHERDHLRNVLVVFYPLLKFNDMPYHKNLLANLAK